VDVLFASEAAAEVGRRLGRVVSPREITALFYARKLPDDMGPIFSGRQLIKVEAIDRITELLADKPAGEAGTA
jgi:hypothetical protein